MPFFYISAPYLFGSREGTLKEICEVVLVKNIATGREITSLYRHKFKMTNLDTLMFCNDKTLKLESMIEAFLKKIDKQYLDLEEKQMHEWMVRNGDKESPTRTYCYEFRWNDSKYPRNYPIPKLVELFELKLNTVEGYLRAKTNSYNDTKIQLSQNTQKDGNYNIKDLNDLIVEPIVAKKDFIYSKFVTTLIAIVPSVLIEEFLANYELWTDNVIPHSANRLKIPYKDGLTVWSIYIFTAKLSLHADEDEEEEGAGKGPKKEKRVVTPVAEFIYAAHNRLKITVKEFRFESGLSETRKKKKYGLEGRLKMQTKAVAEICLAYFSEIYELYLHTKMIRLLIYTNMRFGNDPTVIYWIEAVPGKEKIVQGLLVYTFGDKESYGLYGTKDEIDDGYDFFPFIYVPGMTF